MLKTHDARDRLESEFGVVVTTQTVTLWVKQGKVSGKKVGGRYYVDWDSLRDMVHAPDDSAT